MKLSTGAIALWTVSIGGASAFSTPATSSVAFVGRASSVSNARTHSAGCSCPSCVSVHPAGCACAGCVGAHPATCLCMACTGRRSTALFADVTDAAEDVEVPAEIEAMDGVESEEEAHNVERPARSQLKKKKKGKELSEFEVGSMVTGTVKSITSYGAFIDIGASTDGLLHISQLAAGYVANVGDVIKEGQEVEVRIVSVDTAKGQVALSMITKEEASRPPQRRERPQRQARRDDSAALASLSEKGWDPAAFVEGTVVSTVDFGCFVRVDISKLNSECEGEIDGLVHVSALSNNRVNTVTDVVNVDDKVQVRVKSITGNKVSLTMLSSEDENAKQDAIDEARGTSSDMGASDWEESYGKILEKMPTFKNGPVIMRK